MNAYKAWVDYGDGSTVVFAETRNQAKVIALSCDCCEDAKYTDVRVHRMKEADGLYKIDCAFDALADIKRIEMDTLDVLYAVIGRIGE